MLKQGPDTWHLVFYVPLRHRFHRKTCQLKLGIINKIHVTRCYSFRLNLVVLFSYFFILSLKKSVVPKNVIVPCGEVGMGFLIVKACHVMLLSVSAVYSLSVVQKYLDYKICAKSTRNVNITHCQ